MDEKVGLLNKRTFNFYTPVFVGLNAVLRSRATCRLQPAEQAHLADAPNIVLYETSLNSNILKMNDLISSAVALMTTFAELINQ